ncbi:hypothetical protein [Sphingobium sp.]|uniref:hypothetical protein n=1 Tax=Sphingobium sp. TaxID=1912891 RepID=UPI002C9F8A4E|nr:hypothetical protein [Sphingobium sp.]HUD91005.1 hypothetical protein [Sphingobium sp.]
MARAQNIKKVVILLLTVAVMNPVSAEPRRRLSVDFDEGQSMLSRDSNTIVDARNGADFRATVDKGTKAVDRPEVVSQGCNTPPGCLRVSMDPSAKGAAKNKIMYSFWSHYKPLPGGEQGRLRIGGGIARISFAMKFDPRYDTPLHQMIHFQILQPKVAGRVNKVSKVNPGGPILSLRIVPVSRRKNKSPDIQEFIVAVRSPQAQSYYYYDTRDKGVLYRGEIHKGDWNNFSFVLQSIDRAGDMGGRIGFWMNDQKRFDKPVEWGFDPDRYGVSPQLGFELGSYRSADATGHQTVYFDDVKVDR